MIYHSENETVYCQFSTHLWYNLEGVEYIQKVLRKIHFPKTKLCLGVLNTIESIHSPINVNDRVLPANALIVLSRNGTLARSKGAFSGESKKRS